MQFKEESGSKFKLQKMPAIRSEFFKGSELKLLS